MRSAADNQSRPLTAASPYPEAVQPADLPMLHRAAWLVPIASPPLQNGAVLLKGSHILAAGPYRAVKAASPAGAGEVDHGSAAILPGLVNAHTHLELSGLQGRIELPQESFAKWLTTLLALRPLMTQEFLEAGLAGGQQELSAGGCCLCGDITNGACVKPAPLTPHPFLTRQVFLEILGFDREHLAEVFVGEPGSLLEATPISNVPFNLAAHACYSTSAALIREAKAWCRARGRWFSIHVAEPPDEIEFLGHGAGFCREVLEGLGRWDPQWVPPGTSAVRYLDELRVLDAKTLLVHAVHLNDDDWQRVVRNRCPVCFCPRSNGNLKVGQPDIGKAWRSGLTVALGTDSLASNTDLNLFTEAAHVLDRYSEVPSEAAIQMATLGGARALGYEQHFGSIEPGKRADLLVVSVPASLPARQLHETVIHHGTKGAWQWLRHRANRYDWAKSVI